MAVKKRDNLEYEFLPAALEITETPPSPVGRFIIWFIFFVFAAAITWSYIGTIDEVAVARGKIIPDGRLKVIQPMEEGMIKAIYVKEGQRVKKGQLLIELDSTFKKSDVDNLESNYASAAVEREVLLSELGGITSDEVMDKKKREVNKMSGDDIESLRQLKEARENEYLQRKETMEIIITQRESELTAAESNLVKLKKRNEELTAEEETLAYLFKAGSIPKKKWQDKQSELFANTREIETQEAMVKQANEKIEEAKKNILTLEQERKSNIYNQVVEKERTITDVKSKLAKAKKSYELQKLISPVDGTINGLAVYTIGGVVTPSQPVVTIVPDDTPIMVEAQVLNQDIGFIKLNQEVELKLDTFPFQKYGFVKGDVVHISPDSFEDEKKTGQLMYKTNIKMRDTAMKINGRAVNLTPGMSLTAEIKTGKRRIIEFFLSPIMKSMDESLKLR